MVVTGYDRSRRQVVVQSHEHKTRHILHFFPQAVIIPWSMASYSFKYPRTAHVGHKVSHAKNRSKRPFRYNLHTVTVVVDGKKQRMKVPTKVLRQFKKAGVTTHWQKPKTDS